MATQGQEWPAWPERPGPGPGTIGFQLGTHAVKVATDTSLKNEAVTYTLMGFFDGSQFDERILCL